MAKPLTTVDIDWVMMSDPYTRELFGGTKAIDQLPVSRPKGSVCYIINTSPSNHPGTHWIAVYLNDTVDEYFCSYGSDPPKEVRRLLRKPYKRTEHLTQNISSNLCGQYCILYLLSRCRGHSLEKFMATFTTVLYANDLIVQTYFD